MKTLKSKDFGKQLQVIHGDADAFKNWVIIQF